MNTPFFITSLPRSRTSWFSALCTTDRSLCFHEPIKTAALLIEENPGFAVGITDSTLALNFAELKKQFPNAPWLYIEREPAVCQRSMIEFARATMALPADAVAATFADLIEAGRAVKAHARTMVVSFDDVNESLPRIWNHLLPGQRFCPARAEILKRLDVQQQFAARLAERLPLMKGSI
jgi:hypothetical protein